MLWLALLWSALLTTFFAAGLCAGSILANRRWSEKCARCQSLYDRIRTTQESTMSDLAQALSLVDRMVWGDGGMDRQERKIWADYVHDMIHPHPYLTFTPTGFTLTRRPRA